jgi:hypothetical protein
MKLFSSVPQPLGLTILLDIGRMALSVTPKITRMTLKPDVDPWVIPTAAIRVFLSPSGISLSL